jgi:hypothetical protein
MVDHSRTSQTVTEGFFSSKPSKWLRVIAWFFKLGGFLFAFMALFALVALILDLSPSPGNPSFAFALLVLSAMAGALLATGFLLARGAREGALMALAVTLYPLAFVLIGRRPLSWLDIVVGVVSVAVIATIWPQLSWRRASTSVQ